MRAPVPARVVLADLTTLRIATAAGGESHGFLENHVLLCCIMVSVETPESTLRLLLSTSGSRRIVSTIIIDSRHHEPLLACSLSSDRWR